MESDGQSVSGPDRISPPTHFLQFNKGLQSD
jgi:hypothetical protein